MRIAGYRYRDSYGLGVVDGDTVVPIADFEPNLPHELAAILAMPGSLDRIRDGFAGSVSRIPLEEVAMDLPLCRPGKIVCLGLNYAAHAAEGPYELPDYPSTFLRTAESLVPHMAPIIRPLCSEQLDFEAEVVAVVGTAGRHIPESKGLDHVAGYACFNDASIREYQRKTTQWTMGKNFDGTGAFGPWFVTADDLPPGAKGLHIESRLNGQVMQSANTDAMVFDVAKTVALVSEVMTLRPGDLLVMGTPEGVGHARKPPVWMRDGDICEIDVEGIGVLRNPIRDEGAGTA